MSLQAKHPLHFLDPKTRTLSVPDYSDETLAVWSAAAPWTLLAKKGASADSKRVHSDERDPRHRILLRVITDLDGQIVGLVGVVVDDRYFAQQALPKAIRSTLVVVSQGRGVRRLRRQRAGRADPAWLRAACRSSRRWCRAG